MEDRNSNGLNDTLILTLTTDVKTAGDYLFLADLIDKNGIISNTTNATNLVIGQGTVNITFNSTLMSQQIYNYSIRIFNNLSVLVYRKDKISTQFYADYEKGIALGTIKDGNFNNNYIQINLSINSTLAETVNVSVFLTYKNISSISQTAEVTLVNGNQTIPVNVSNETIKSTHSNTTYIVDRVQIGNKLFDTNHSTALYIWKDFAKTSYIRQFIDGKRDENNNNLSEWLELNVTINATTPDTYIIEGELRDEFDQFVLNFTNNTGNLGIGQYTIPILLNGTAIYQSKINGPYVISFIKLKNSTSTYDTIFNAYTTNASFFDDFEKPPLPDLTINLSVHFDNQTNMRRIGINISNIGKAPAYNVFMDAFNNVSFENQTFTANVNVSQIFSFGFNISNDANNTIYTAIVDFHDVVEELNESNNVATNANLTLTPNPGWWDANWKYRQFINITNNLTQDALPTDFTMNITVDTAGLIAAGKLNSDCSDLRIIYQNTTALDWIFQLASGCNRPDTVIAFALDANITANSFDDKNYALYYGNPSIIAFPSYDEDKVYLFFDDFGNASFSGSLDTTKWEWSAMAIQPTITNGVLVLDPDDGLNWQDYVQTIKTYDRHYYNITFDWTWRKGLSGTWSMMGYQDNFITNKGAQLYDQANNMYASREGLNFNMNTVVIPGQWYNANVRPNKDDTSFYLFNRSNTTLSPENKNLYHFGLLDGDLNDVYRIDNLTIQYFAIQRPSVELTQEETQNGATESKGRIAIEQGINSSLETNRSIFTDQKVYIRYPNNNQKWGSFDKVAMKGVQRWAFNYVTGTEQFTNIVNLNNRVLIWENQSLTSDEIREQVSRLINQTEE
ncbi:hypothetical protein HYS48_00320 [Candidatus Woesearchaeota archaeon]|nr:hypothetical protein [Candidatus Woesearchaeota archaeon]